jgi:CDP-glucose 4,6-dehydratase
VSGPVIEGSPTLVTGGQGFIGAWLSERLAAGGAHVVVPVRGIDPAARFWAEGIAERCTVVRTELSDRGALERLLDEHSIEVVYHLAAQPIVGVANRSPYGTWESNVRGTYTVLDACRARIAAGAGPRRIVVASSDHCYGDHDELPFREDFPFRAEFPYDVSKACTDMIAQSYARSLGLPIAVMRLANVYGGGDLNWSRIVPDTARALVEGRRPAIRSDGSPERDYVYVEDAVDAYLTLAGSLDDERRWGRAWNAGNGRGVSVLELVQRLIAASGRATEPDIQGHAVPVAEIQRQYLDATAIRTELGWEPRWDLDRGLAAAFGWYERLLAGAVAVG